ncbi:MAG: hypothetical protein II900_05960 [Prevotella sp.]|nr:hypothetical protein [Prevotella sp.]
MIKFSIAQSTGAHHKKNTVLTYICKNANWLSKLMKRTESQCEKIEAEPDKKKRDEMKSYLPIKIPHAWMENEANRDSGNAHANGTVMCDYDALDTNPRELWEEKKEIFLAMNPLEVEISASGKGLHAWFIIPDGLTLKEAQLFYAKRLGLRGKIDERVCDLARGIYVVPERNTLYRDWEALFGDKVLEAPVPTQEEIAEIRGGEKAILPESKAEPDLVLPKTDGQRKFPIQYQDILFSDILKGLLRKNPDITLNEKGEPEEGCRHSAEVYCAQHMKTLTDSNPEWLAEIIPNWEEDERAWKSAILSAKSYDVKYQSSKILKEVIAEIRQKKQAEESPTDWRYAETEPPLPKYLPKPAKILTEKCPKQTHPAVLNAVFSALATHTSGVWFKTIAGEKLELNMLTATLADSAGGKTSTEYVSQVIMESISKADDEALEREEDWKQDATRKSANAEGEKRPEALIQSCMQTMSEAVLMRRLSVAKRQGGKFLYCYYDELKSMLGLSKSKRAIKSLMCASFDSKMYGKECDGKDYLSARAPMRFNTHFNGVVSEVKDWMEDGLTDGYFNRVSFSFIKQDRSQEFVYGDFDDEYSKKLEPYLKNLREKKGEIVCPQALEVARELRKETQLYTDLTEDLIFEQLSRRAITIAHRKALILYIADGCKWTKELGKFMRWSFRYDMWCKMHFFGKALANARKKEEVTSKVTGPKNQLLSLPDTFTFDQYRQFRKANGFRDDKSSTDATLRTWKSRKHVRQNPDGTYTKLKYTSA